MGMPYRMHPLSPMMPLTRSSVSMPMAMLNVSTRMVVTMIMRSPFLIVPMTMMIGVCLCLTHGQCSTDCQTRKNYFSHRISFFVGV